MRMLFAVLVALGFFATSARAGNDAPTDRRSGAPLDYNGYFPWTPPTSLQDWEVRRKAVREQVLVANGLWPMPEKTPLTPVIHGKVERDGYTVEKVFFASYPGHFVTGNLYRPTGRKGKLAGVLCPHGHWANGRFFEAGDKAIEKELASGAEKRFEGAKYPLQARCVQLARLGCVVFHYDMVGYADSKQIPHREGFKDVEAELRLQNFMGLQTWNSIRSLDFLLGLPEVDPARIGVTGASGGGTQTFILGAIDDRPTVAFPAVMVSTAMQGGCTCENCSYLRVGTGNIELAGVFAPRPLGMSAALDWTKDIETKGLPELKALYRLHGAEDNVMAKAYLQFGHNYNQVARELMYGWFNKHLRLGHAEPIGERPFVPIAPKDLSVYDAAHPLPKDALDVAELRRYLTTRSEQQLQALVPTTAQQVEKLHDILLPALRTLIGDELPAASEVEGIDGGWGISRRGKGEVVKVRFLAPVQWDGRAVVWVDDGSGDRAKALEVVRNQRAAVCLVDVFSGRKTPVNKTFAGYTFGYNRPLLAERVHDILTAVAWTRGQPGVKTVHLAGFGTAGPATALARGLCGSKVERAAADLNGFRFEQVKEFDDPMMLPGALKYGGLTGLVAVAAPHELYLHNLKGTGPAPLLEAAYQAAGQSQSLVRRDERMDPGAVVEWLLR